MSHVVNRVFSVLVAVMIVATVDTAQQRAYAQTETTSAGNKWWIPRAQRGADAQVTAETQPRTMIIVPEPQPKAAPTAAPAAPADSQAKAKTKARDAHARATDGYGDPQSRPKVAVVAGAPTTVAFPGYPIGTIVVRTDQRRLYLVVSEGRAISYPVGVGRAGQQWTGSTRISGKYIKPAWTPPAIIKKAQPKLPNVIEGGSPKNPMGAAALTLSGGEYAIHGTNSPGSIGGFVSYGCIRMHNNHIMDLYARVSVGTQVIVMR